MRLNSRIEMKVVQMNEMDFQLNKMEILGGKREPNFELRGEKRRR